MTAPASPMAMTLLHIGFRALTGTPVVVYGQTELTRDLYDARADCGAPTEFQVDHVTIHDADSDATPM